MSEALFTGRVFEAFDDAWIECVIRDFPKHKRPIPRDIANARVVGARSHALQLPPDAIETDVLGAVIFTWTGDDSHARIVCFNGAVALVLASRSSRSTRMIQGDRDLVRALYALATHLIGVDR